MKKTLILALALVMLLQVGIAFAAVDINTASAAQLAQLKGIGKVKAAAIVADRKAHGKYQNLNQLTRVSGIGKKTVAELKGEATVSGDAQASSKADAKKPQKNY